MVSVCPSRNHTLYVLYETVASTTSLFFLLQLHKFELAKRFKNILQITLGDAEMDVPDVQPVKRNLAEVAGRRLRVASQSILLRFRMLGNDGDP